MTVNTGEMTGKTTTKTSKRHQTLSYVCSYVPAEIIMAAGLIPRRMIPEAQPFEGEAYLHPNTCGYLKSLLASLIGGGASETAGLVLANCCDGMRRLNDICNAAPNVAPVFFIDVPKKKDPDSIEFFSSELRRFATDLEARFRGARVSKESINGAIRTCNDVRRLMHEILLSQRYPGSSVRGSSVFNLCIEGADTDAESFADALRAFAEKSREPKQAVVETGPRVVLTGNAMHQPDLIGLIEESGGKVVCLDTCIVGRHHDRLVVENSEDPVRALAERYLLRAPCARMEGIEERFLYLKDLVRDSRANAIVYCMTKFCDAYAYDAPFMRNRFREAGIPFLLVENNYEWTGLGQTRTRIEGFFEMIDERRVRHHV